MLCLWCSTGLSPGQVTLLSVELASGAQSFKAPTPSQSIASRLAIRDNNDGAAVDAGQSNVNVIIVESNTAFPAGFGDSATTFAQTLQDNPSIIFAQSDNAQLQVRLVH